MCVDFIYDLLACELVVYCNPTFLAKRKLKICKMNCPYLRYGKCKKDNVIDYCVDLQKLGLRAIPFQFCKNSFLK
jgi:hypothetical protein